MKKTILILFILTLSASGANFSDFLSKLSRAPKKQISEITKVLAKTSKKSKRDLTLESKIPQLPIRIAKNPEKALIAQKANQIISKGKFEKNFFENQNFQNQLNIIAQSAKYGDKYFKVAQEISSISPKILKNPVILKHLPNPNINQKSLQEKFIELLNKGGKYAWIKLNQILDIAKKHPKLAASGTAGIAVAVWYVTDPDGYNEAVKNSGKTLTEFVLDTSSSFVSGVGEGIVEKATKAKNEIVNSVSDNVNNVENKGTVSSMNVLNFVVGILVLIVVFIIWRKRKIIKHFLLKADEVKEKRDVDEEY